MKRKSINLFVSIICLSVIAGFHNFSSADAQTVQNPNQGSRVRQIPTPTVTPTPLKPAPTATPAVEDDGELVIKTELVNLNVRVVDRNNRSVGTLKQDDFKIFEDNVAQPIEFFTKAEVPTNYSLVIDNSGSLRAQLDKVIEAGKIIVNTNLPADETSIIRFVSRDKISIEQEFTSSKKDLQETLDENLFIEGGQTAVRDAVYLAAEGVTDYEKTRDPNERKRRAIILVTDGDDRDSFYTEQQLFNFLKETDVQIFVVGFIGDLDKDSGFISKSPQNKAKAFLEKLASETGGKSYFPDNISELNDIASNIATELRTQYLVSYQPTNEKQDGSLRNIRVIVADGPNKQKRIAVTRNSRKAVSDSAPLLQGQKPKGE